MKRTLYPLALRSFLNSFMDGYSLSMILICQLSFTEARYLVIFFSSSVFELVVFDYSIIISEDSRFVNGFGGET